MTQKQKQGAEPKAFEATHTATTAVVIATRIVAAAAMATDQQKMNLYPFEAAATVIKATPVSYNEIDRQTWETVGLLY